MKLGRLTTTAALVASTAGLASADTVFNTTGDFNTAGNWDNGLPTATNGPGTIMAGTTATMSANYLMANNGSPSVTDIRIDGTLNTGAFELQLRSGTVAANPDVIVGFNAGSNGILNIENGGRLDIAGAAADLFMGSAPGAGSGTVNVLDGGNFQVQKAVEVLTGTLSFADGAILVGNVQDELVVADTGTLAFEIDAAGDTYVTIVGSSLQVELGTASTLDLSFSTGPTNGQSFTLINGVSSFTGSNSVGFTGGTGVFGTVNATGLGAGQSVNVTYDNGELVATIVPEPGSLALLGLGGLALLRRRR